MNRFMNLASLRSRTPKAGQTVNRIVNLATVWSRKPKVGQTPADVVFRENKWRLLRYRPRAQGLAFETPVFLVPSLINRHYVLDLMPGKSFIEYLVGVGHPVYIIDWGEPSDEDRYLTFDDICDRYLGRAIRVAAENSPRGAVHLLGYCMGGTLAVIHAAARPERVASLVAIAAPVHFEPGGLLTAWTRTRSFNVDALVEGLGNIPWPLLQASFHLLRPTMGLSKTVYLVDRAWNDEFLDGFLALETWGNDNVSLPGEFYRTYLNELYRADALVRGTFVLSGRPVLLSNLTCPTLAVTFEHDNIVPAPSATPLIELIGATDKQRQHLSGGHVGAVVSKKASTTLWPQLSGFWASRDSQPSPTRNVVHHRSNMRADPPIPKAV